MSGWTMKVPDGGSPMASMAVLSMTRYPEIPNRKHGIGLRAGRMISPKDATGLPT